MADVSGITAVRPHDGASVSVVEFGATVSVGQLLYLDTTDNSYKLADADDTSTTATVRALALTPGVDGSFGAVLTAGGVTLVGASLSVGESYVASDSAGGIKPNTDLATGDYVTEIGRASSTTDLTLRINATGIQMP